MRAATAVPSPSAPAFRDRRSGVMARFRVLPPVVRGVLLLLPGLLVGRTSGQEPSNPAPAARDLFPRVTPLAALAPRAPGFVRLLPAATGIRFTNFVAESRSLTNHILLNGSGVAAGDVDGDGRCDLYFCRIDGPNALYRNLGDWKFEDISGPAGVACPQLDATGAVLADLDGDGDLDLLVSAIRGGVSCFLNDGQGRFADVTSRSGLASTTASMSMALGDIDGDGDLDLYVSNYRNETLRDGFRMQIRVGTVNGRKVVTRVNNRALQGPDLEGWVTLDEQGNISENGQADALYRNEGGGRFVHVPFVGGAFLDEQGRALTGPLHDWTLTALFRDLDGDRAPDLYVCSDLASPDRIWLNRGNGVFRAAPPTSFRKTSWFSMGVDCADLDRDGRDELLVTDMVSREHRLRQVQVSDHQPVFSRSGVYDDRPQAPRNTLFRTGGDGDWLEIAYFSGLEASDWSWSPVFLDVDLDGYEDVLVATGFERDVQDVDIANQLEAIRQNRRLSDLDALRMRARFPRLALPNLAFRNRGDLTFEESGRDWGFDAAGVSQGLALADLDNDGDLDVVVNDMNDAAGVYRNESAGPRVAVRLRGAPPNTRGVGARIRVLGATPFVQSQEIQSGGRYLSSDDPVRTFAVTQPANPVRIEVDWRRGGTTVVTNVPSRALVEIAEPVPAVVPAAPVKAPATPLFENRDAALAHVHRDPDFDDFARQPMLPRKFSQSGPGVAWVDLDRDGREDLVIGTGAGGRLGVFRNDGRGGFQGVAPAGDAGPKARDTAGIVSVPEPGTGVGVVVGESNYEDPPGTSSLLHRLALAGTNAPALALGPEAVGPLAAADADADGELELFVGGRALGGRFPQPVDSRLFRRRAGAWVPDEMARAMLEGVGLVSGALFCDLEGDGFPELVLACDWGPLRVFRNARGHWTPWSPRLIWPSPLPTTSGYRHAAPELTSLDHLTGWWNGIAAGDFDGDGRLDLLASNWGQNSKFENHRARALQLHFGDFAESGEVHPVESYWEPSLGKQVPWMHLGRFAAALPGLAGRFRSFREFGGAGVADLLGERLATARVLEARWLETTLFLNRPNGFEVRPLPPLAQWSPAFGIAVADFDGDGHEDAFLGQNFFATEPETGRYDGGRGLCLLGDGRGGWRPLEGAESGIVVYGEQRGAAVADFDADGRADLVVTQNGAATRLFRNARGRAGLRVRLVGPPGNPDGVGAVLRLRFAGGSGPVREIHAGSGYWSQDGAVAVLATPGAPVTLEVQWPGGGRTETPVPLGARELRVTATGLAQP